MKKNERVKAVCIDYTADGQGVVKVDGYPLFVKGLMLNEKAELKVLKTNKNYGYAKIHKLLEKNKERRNLPCPYANICGGCQLQYMEHTSQLEMKYRNVSAMMQRIGKLNSEVQPVLSGNEFNYRNKTQIPVQVINEKVHMGFYRRHSNEIIDMKSCMIQNDAINEVYQSVRELLDENIEIAKRIKHVLFKYAVGSRQMMVVLITNTKEVEGINEFVEELIQKESRIYSVIQNINLRKDNVILGDEEKLLYGKETIEDTLLDLRFSISSKSFYQINYEQTHVLYNKVIELANLTGKERVLDLYCGIGTISLYVAKYCKEVVGVEIIEEAIVNAKENATNNNINNVTFVCSDAASFATSLEEKKEHVDVIIVDPPRKGLDDITIQSIVKMNPERLVYVSCDPSTLARDLYKLTQAQYECVTIQPIDMFPQTYHVENVVLLSRK